MVLDDEAARLRLVREHVRSHLLRLDRQLVHRIDVALDDPLRAVVRAAHAHDRPSVLPHERDLPSLDHRLAIHLMAQLATLLVIRKQIGEAPRKQFFLGLVSQHAGQGRIDVDEPIIRRDDVNSFLQ